MKGKGNYNPSLLLSLDTQGIFCLFYREGDEGRDFYVVDVVLSLKKSLELVLESEEVASSLRVRLEGDGLTA